MMQSLQGSWIMPFCVPLHCHYQQHGHLQEHGMTALLQDSTRYEKTQKLLEKYDPEYVPSSPSRGFSNSTHFGAATTPGIRHRNISQVQAQGNAGMMSPLAGAYV